MWSAGQFTTLDGPGAIFTGAGGINPEGDIVGRYRSADRVFHGFLWSKGPEVNEQKLIGSRISRLKPLIHRKGGK